MFGSKKAVQNSNAQEGNKPAPPQPLRKITPSVISSDMNILGNVHSDGFIDVDGRIDGNIRCQHTTIRENGCIKGDVVADQVTVYGKVEGLIKAKMVMLHASAKVEGVIMHETLSIEDGAFVDGKFKRLDKVFMDEEHQSLKEPSLEDLVEGSMSMPEESGLDDALRLIN